MPLKQKDNKRNYKYIDVLKNSKYWSSNQKVVDDSSQWHYKT